MGEGGKPPQPESPLGVLADFKGAFLLSADGEEGSMMRKSTEKKIEDAFKLLTKHGILCYVPGCFDITSKEMAVLFAKDRHAFYRRVQGE
jgi:hypothetical protein